MRNIIVLGVILGTMLLAVLVGRVRDPGADETATVAKVEDDGVPHIGRIQILNGCGIDGLAWHVAEKLRGSGFDVKNDGIDNAPTFNYPKTLVASRTRDTEIARRVGSTLGVEDDQVIMLREKGDERFDVTVFVGPDMQRIGQK